VPPWAPRGYPMMRLGGTGVYPKSRTFLICWDVCGSRAVQSEAAERVSQRLPDAARPVGGHELAPMDPEGVCGGHSSD
jgi:hypothetical protein